MTNCEHLRAADNICHLASTMAHEPIETTPEICRGCSRCDHPQDINEVTLALADIKDVEHGPGSRLQKLISWFISQPTDCNCPNRVKLMNSWGVEGCRREKATILGWLRESALDNNYAYSEFMIAAVLNAILLIPYSDKSRHPRKTSDVTQHT